MNNPNEFVKFLNSNKKIHINGLIRNGISYLIIALFIICGIEVLSTIGYIALIINTFSTIINFECVNLQNYNLKRFELSKDKYEKVRLKKEESDIKKYGKISEVVSQEFSKTNDIPNVEDIVSNITTKEQLEQMRNLLLSNSNQGLGREKKKILKKGGV